MRIGSVGACGGIGIGIVLFEKLVYKPRHLSMDYLDKDLCSIGIDYQYSQLNNHIYMY